MINIRKAEKTDIKQIAAIYEHIHNEESCGRLTTGWIKMQWQEMICTSVKMRAAYLLPQL